MHIKVFVVYEEALAHCGVTVFVGLEVEFDLVREKGTLMGGEEFSLVGEDGRLVPVLLSLELLEQLLLARG